MTNHQDLMNKMKRVDELLKSQAVYDYMFDLMWVSSSMKRRTPKEQAERIMYDKIRPELKGKDARTSFAISQTLQFNEKRELLRILQTDERIRGMVTLKVLVEYDAVVDRFIFADRLKDERIVSPYKIASAPFKLPIQEERVRRYA